MNYAERAIMVFVSIVVLVGGWNLDGPDFVRRFGNVASGIGFFCLNWALIIDPILSDVFEKSASRKINDGEKT